MNLSGTSRKSVVELMEEDAHFEALFLTANPHHLPKTDIEVY